MLSAALLVGTFQMNAQCELQRGPVVINEFLASNETIAQNSIGAFEDYIELYNTSSEAFDLEGYFLSDSRGNNGRLKYRFEDVTIPGNGYLIIWADGTGDPEMAGLNANFSLSGTEGERVVLSNPDSVIVDYVRFGPIESDVSIGRFPNGTGPFTRMVPTHNGANTNGETFNVVINEYMATNGGTAADEFGENDDWIELYNNGSQAVDLTGYLLSDNEAIPEKFTFPQGSVLGPDEYFIVWADNQPEQGPYHADFALSASGEKVILSLPDTSTVDFFAFGEQTTDISEGRFPNGLGNLIPCMAPTFSSENIGTVNTRDDDREISELRVYPNPVSNILFAENPARKLLHAQLFDMSGRMVRQQQLLPGRNEIKVAGLTPSLYILRTEVGGTKIVVTD